MGAMAGLTGCSLASHPNGKTAPGVEECAWPTEANNMSYYDPFQRYYRSQRPAQQRTSAYNQQAPEPQRRPQPTIEDYYKLAQAHEALQKERDELAKEVATSQEALRQQTKKAIDLNEELRTTQASLQQVQAELDDLSRSDAQAEGEWQERYQRLQAETENYRRRLEQRAAAEVTQQRHQILADMLALADHLEMALQHLDRQAEQSPLGVETGENFRQNIEATLRSFLETLKKYGVQPVAAMGQPFDPELHEALGRVANPDVPEDHVAVVVRTGYQVDDQLLRPARVLVSGQV
jgi:molecular chaperone GrpE